jgi:transcriptional regulator with XRE-family HTH domain
VALERYTPPMNKRQALRKVIEHLIGNETQAAIGRRGGLTGTEISLYKMGRRYPTEKNREKLAKGLRCSLQQLDALEWQYRTSEDSEEAEIPERLVVPRERLTEFDSSEIADPELREIFETFSMASHHAAALSDSMLAVTKKLMAHFGEQQAAAAAAADDAKPRRRRAPSTKE